MKRPHFFTAKSLDERWEENASQVRLWRATLDQLLQDLIYEGNGKEDKKAHVQAWEWFKNEQDDFDLVCDLADLDSTRTKKELYELIGRVRNDRDKGKFKDSFKIVRGEPRTRVRKQKGKP